MSLNPHQQPLSPSTDSSVQKYRLGKLLHGRTLEYASQIAATEDQENLRAAFRWTEKDFIAVIEPALGSKTTWTLRWVEATTEDNPAQPTARIKSITFLTVANPIPSADPEEEEIATIKAQLDAAGYVLPEMAERVDYPTPDDVPTITRSRWEDLEELRIHQRTLHLMGNPPTHFIPFDPTKHSLPQRFTTSGDDGLDGTLLEPAPQQQGKSQLGHYFFRGPDGIVQGVNERKELFSPPTLDSEALDEIQDQPRGHDIHTSPITDEVEHFEQLGPEEELIPEQWADIRASIRQAAREYAEHSSSPTPSSDQPREEELTAEPTTSQQANPLRQLVSRLKDALASQNDTLPAFVTLRTITPAPLGNVVPNIAPNLSPIPGFTSAPSMAHTVPSPSNPAEPPRTVIHSESTESPITVENPSQNPPKPSQNPDTRAPAHILTYSSHTTPSHWPTSQPKLTHGVTPAPASSTPEELPTAQEPQHYSSPEEAREELLTAWVGNALTTPEELMAPRVQEELRRLAAALPADPGVDSKEEFNTPPSENDEGTPEIRHSSLLDAFVSQLDPAIEEDPYAGLPLLVGLGGLYGSGKDEVASVFELEGAKRLGFSDALHEALLIMNPFIAEGCGSSYRSLAEDYGYVGAKELPGFRKAMTGMGAAIRSQNPDHWVIECQKAIDEARAAGFSVVVTGVRQRNELEMLKRLGGTTFWVERPDFERDPALLADVSERGLTAEDFDGIIMNDRTLEVLHRRAKSVWGSLVKNSTVSGV